MNNQIELSQLQCYLAFGLKGKHSVSYQEIGKNNVDCDMIGINLDVIRLQCYDIYGEKWEMTTGSLFEDFKPLLIPLTSLTNQQWVEIFKAALNKEIDTEYFTRYEDKVIYIDRDQMFDYWITFTDYGISFYGAIYFNQLSAFQKLFGLHADVWGWVEAGLAEDKLEHGK